MPKSENERNRVVDTLLQKLNKNFHSFLLAKTILQFGEINLQDINDNAVVQIPLSSEDAIEPIPIGELRQYSDFFPTFLVEVFHGKAVSFWQDFLTEIFSLYVELHFEGIRRFVELGTAQIRFDFRCEGDVTSHVTERVVQEFTFRAYIERQKTIAKICAPVDPTEAYSNALYEIHKNVIIRNCLHHSDGILHTNSVGLLGRQTFEVIDDGGNISTLDVGSRITVSLQEFYRFHRSLVFVGQMWRKPV